MWHVLNIYYYNEVTLQNTSRMMSAINVPYSIYIYITNLTLTVVLPSRLIAASPKCKG